MRQKVAILLCVLVILTSLRDLLTYAQFYANQDYIADNLCINRFETQTLCSGKCYLVANLDVSDDNNQATRPQKIKERNTNVFFCDDVFQLPKIRAYIEVEEDLALPTYLDNHWQTYIDSIFHPPQFC